jgi:hypothetical protein
MTNRRHQPKLASSFFDLRDAFDLQVDDVVRSVHNLGDGHKSAGQTAAQVVAPSAQARDCCGVVGAGSVGVDRCAAIRHEHQHGFRLA